MPERVVVLLSGGLDSSTLLYQQHSLGRRVIPLSIEYGQRHVRELIAADAIAQSLGLVNTVITLPTKIFTNAESSQVGKWQDVPHGHYAAENMKTTIVPNRNMLLIATAVAVAISQGARYVAYAAHAGDHAIYPDCRPQFVGYMRDAIAHCDWNPPELAAPFVGFTKADIVRAGAELGVPFQLTYSCYAGQHAHCGLCGTCVERKEAFQEAGIEDPTIYVA